MEDKTDLDKLIEFLDKRTAPQSTEQIAKGLGVCRSKSNEILKENAAYIKSIRYKNNAIVYALNAKGHCFRSGQFAEKNAIVSLFFRVTQERCKPWQA